MKEAVSIEELQKEVDRLRELHKQIVAKAVTSLWMDYGPDYRGDIWEILGMLDPEAAEAVEEDPRAARKKYAPDPDLDNEEEDD